MVSPLPLKEDLEEYELVFKAFLTLYSAGHSVTPQCIPKIVESAAHFTTAHNVDKTKVRLFWSGQFEYHPLLRIAPSLAFHAFGSRNVEAEQLGSILALPCQWLGQKLTPAQMA